MKINEVTTAFKICDVEWEEKIFTLEGKIETKEE